MKKLRARTIRRAAARREAKNAPTPENLKKAARRLLDNVHPVMREFIQRRGLPLHPDDIFQDPDLVHTVTRRTK